MIRVRSFHFHLRILPPTQQPCCVSGLLSISSPFYQSFCIFASFIDLHFQPLSSLSDTPDLRERGVESTPPFPSTCRPLSLSLRPQVPWVEYRPLLSPLMKLTVVTTWAVALRPRSRTKHP
ncbi:hypothetical protein ASPCAL12033 [Aspergillus calidoustus]|uniref:Uncharacterized protein n=1 Tax=Aspergillus calidoustus TaxID=454130 RepID=A0A0U5GE06_ASPCI|nr:hypothetical protein ASPCAL12033 [Aspergillus calidoustus]